MFRVNYRRPEDLPSHQRDFPPRALAQHGDGSGQLALMVGLYLLAMSAGLALLVGVTPLTQPNTAIAGH